jgi:hypothetical protein
MHELVVRARPLDPAACSVGWSAALESHGRMFDSCQGPLFQGPGRMFDSCPPPPQYMTND